METSAGGGGPSGGARDLGAGSLGGGPVAVVHGVDDGGIGVGKVGAGVAFTDDGEIVQVFGDDGEFSAAESGGSVVHEGAVIVRHTEVAGALHFVEIVPHVGWDVVEKDLDAVVTVGTALFVVETDGVSQFVGDDSVESTSAFLDGHLVRTMVVSDAGVTSAAAEDLDGVSVTGAFGFGASGGDEFDASLTHPHLHTGVDGVHFVSRVAGADSVWDDSLGPSVV